MSHTDPNDDLHNPEVAYEHSDINVRALIAAAAGLGAITLGIVLLMMGMFSFLENRAAASDPPISPLAQPATQMPATTRGNPYFGEAAGPQLLVQEPAALKKQRGMEDERLQTYGWINEKAGTAHMPISEAKKLILQRGLPVRAGAVPDPSLGTRLPAAGESSGGRIFGKKNEEAAAEEAKPAPAAAPKGHGQ